MMPLVVKTSKSPLVLAIKISLAASSFLALIRAQETSLRLENQSVDAQKSLINNRINLYRELSHGEFVPLNNL